MLSGEPREIHPGISAVLAVPHRTIGLDSVVLDLAAVLDGLVADNFEILVVEFGSGAGQGQGATAQAAQPMADLRAEMAARAPSVAVSVLPDVFVDRPSALAAGFDGSRYDLLFVTTADGQFNVCELNHLLEAIEHGADLALGYRPARADGLLQRLDGWLRNIAVNVAYGRTARDLDCDFKLFRRVVWERLHPSPRPPRGRFNAELLVGARRLGFTTQEVPVSHRRPREAATTAASPGLPVSRAA